MNQDGIRNMSAGLIMDGLIAERIFKFENIKEFKSELSGRTFSGWLDNKNKSVIRPEFWSPSENIESAFEVLAKIAYPFSLNKDALGKWSCAFDIGGRDEYRWVEVDECETAPLAICRAALLATLDKDKDA